MLVLRGWLNNKNRLIQYGPEIRLNRLRISHSIVVETQYFNENIILFPDSIVKEQKNTFVVYV